MIWLANRLSAAGFPALLLGWLVLAVAGAELAPETSREVPPSAEAIKDDSLELSDERLSSIMGEFGKLIENVMHDEMDKLFEDVSAKPDGLAAAAEGHERINKRELDHLKEVHKDFTRDTQACIETAGRKNEGQLTQSGAANPGGQSFLARVTQNLQSAGSFIDHHMSSLSNLAPKVKGKIQALPSNLRKLLHWPSFASFRRKFKRVYESPREELYRQMVYLHSQTIVGIKNLRYLVGRDKYLLKATQFADRTSVEYQQQHNNQQAETSESIKEELDEQMRRQLETMALTGRNVYGGFGPPPGVIMPFGEQHGRRKRSTMVLGRSELDDEEEDEIMNELSDSEDVEMMDASDDSKTVDSYAAGFEDNADLSRLDEMEGLMDEVLADDPLFKPVDLRQMRTMANDQRLASCLIKPENQDNCGACYAYAAAAAASYFNCMLNNEPKPVRYNARFISDCGRYYVPEGKRPTVNGCSGGIMSEAIKFTGLAGTRLFWDYELARASDHDFRSDTCAYPRPESIGNWAPVEVPFFKQSYFQVKKMSDVNLILRTIGPVFINLRTWNNFPLQGSGIYDERDESANPTIHSMLIVGFDRDARGRGYWILWNSHGTAWGEQGFVRVYSESLEYFKTFLGALMTSEMIEQTRQA